MAFGALWIFGTDWLAEVLFPAADWRLVQTIKGWGFVGASGLLIYGLVRREMRRVRRAAHELSETRSELEKGEQRLRNLVSNVSDLILVIGDGARLEYVNPTDYPILGYAPEEVTGRSVLELVHPDDRREVEEALLRSRRAPDTPRRVKLRARRRDGEWRKLEAITVCPSDDSVDGVVVTARDVTERERVRERYATLFAMNPVALSVATLGEGRFLDVNEGFEELYGYDRDRAVGATAHELNLWVDPGDRLRFMQVLRRSGTVHEREVKLRTARGDVADVLLSASLVDEGETQYVMTAAHDITERKEFERQLQRQALYDSLTGLPNRTLLRDRLAHALEGADERKVGLLFLDLDDFKRVNDSLGHPEGDCLLEEVADRLRGCLRSRDTVARFGGDEFCLLLEDVDDRRQVEEAAGRITDSLAEPVRPPSGSEIHVTASIGAVLAGPERADPDDLLRFADAAMYRAKGDGGTSFHLFRDHEDYGVTHRLHRENDLRRALEEDQLEVYYQPVMDLETESVDGVEALVRWNHPERGLLSPAEFIDLAESTGLIVRLGEDVLRKAARTVQGWRGDLIAAGSRFLLSVNLSARQCSEPDLARRVSVILEETGLPVTWLGLEITESVAVQERTAIEQLQELGVRLIIDDFGTGYSSLRYLRRIAADELKIDRSFVSGIDERPRERAIVRAVILMASELGLDAVAEGLERRREVDIVREFGCRYGQGYVFGRPVPAAEMEDRLRSPADVTAVERGE